MKDFNIKDLLETMKKNDISEVVIKEGNKAYEFRRGGFASGSNQAQVVAPLVAAPAMAAAVAPTSMGGASSTDSAPVQPSCKYHEVTSPLVGTFYGSPKPGAPAMIEVGQKVTKGQKLCLVEAMKNFNEIESDVNGVVREVLCKDGELVEFGKVLFRIELN